MDQTRTLVEGGVSVSTVVESNVTAMLNIHYFRAGGRPRILAKLTVSLPILAATNQHNVEARTGRFSRGATSCTNGCLLAQL